MGFLNFLLNLFQSKGPKRRPLNLTPPPDGRTMAQLAPRLGLSDDLLNAVSITYHTFQIPKRSGGLRMICAPSEELKKIQRTILHRLLKRLSSHPSATGFEKDRSIATNASAHVGSEVILRMDIQNFFESTDADRVRAYFYGIGWGQEVADLLIRLCTWNGSLPQGAPTSPRLSNLVNFELDARLDGWARRIGAVYTRYADDITFSFRNLDQMPPIQKTAQNPKTLEKVPQTIQDRQFITATIRITKKVLSEYGYKIHTKKKLNIRRRHQQQKVTGLVVNERVALPRKTRRWLRAVRHHLETGKPASLTAGQLAGWQSLQSMIQKQANLPINE
jgi:RNA-directed DNA polymerase